MPIRTFALLTVMTCLPLSAKAAEITFNRDIRPLLAENCFACHGFDAKKRKADLRLDVPEGAYTERNGTFPIKPGNLEESEIWQRIISDDEETVMPPPSSKKKLTPEQKETIRRWIEQGAKYQKHWAFESVTKPSIPSVKQEAWVKNPVDRFILARLEHEGLTPLPEADRATLIRRVSFALTGLPPTLAEVAAFESDKSPLAYENMVDRYLASPRYGEEMARHWLDVARYADTHGLHLDNERTMWAYRDWVIGAFNENKKFDTFTIEQLAGDLLPQPTREQLIATGFNRCNVTTSEGGSIDAEFLYRYAVDRASTMVQAWMGLTGGCAVCHDHKFDPLSQREFYSLYAFFYSAADPAMDKNINTTDPFFKLTTAEQTALLTKARERENETKRLLEEAASRVEYLDPAEQQPPLDKQSITEVWLDDLFPLGSKPTCSSRNLSVWSTESELPPPSGRRSLKQAGAANYQDKFENPAQPFAIPENATISVSVRVDAYEPPEALMLEVVTQRGSRRAIWGEPTRFGVTRYDKNAAKADKFVLGEIPAPGVWHRLEIPAEKLDLNPGDSVKSVALAQFGGIAWWDGLTIVGDMLPAGDARSSFSVWWKERVGKDTPGIPADLAKILKAGLEKDATDESREKLLRYYLAYIARPVNEELKQRQDDWQQAQAARTTLEESIPGTFIFKELEKPRDAFVMMRGQYDKPGEKVEPGVPAVFPTLKRLSADGRASRLDLANWLLTPEHPLTARVAVNRFWQQFFGTGLVKTSDDFGTQGELPSHPELLDYLATGFASGQNPQSTAWDTKALVRLLITSATFRQETRVTPELLRRDPENRLYARGPRFRLDAEQIRDNALYVSGLINLDMGGRGVKGYQPPNIWEPVGYTDSNTRFYLQDHGKALYRRSVYAFLKRTAPPPFMSNFDAPNREQLCSRRERSNTPLQALQTMNDTQHFEAARAFGERILTEGGTTPEQRITFAWRTVLSRSPRPDELAVVQKSLDQYLTRYRSDAEAARKVIAVGESKPKSGLPEPELAAYTLLANLVLNLDETVTRN